MEAANPANSGLVSFVHAVMLSRTGRSAEADADVTRLLRVTFGAPLTFVDEADSAVLLVKDYPRISELLQRPPLVRTRGCGTNCSANALLERLACARRPLAASEDRRLSGIRPAIAPTIVRRQL